MKKPIISDRYRLYSFFDFEIAKIRLRRSIDRSHFGKTMKKIINYMSVLLDKVNNF